MGGMAMDMQHVSGDHKADIKLYALSTCGWCRKTKTLLDTLGVEYDFVDVDLLEGEDRDEVEQEIDRWNPRHAFPTVVINDETCIVGFDENRIKAVLGV